MILGFHERFNIWNCTAHKMHVCHGMYLGTLQMAALHAFAKAAGWKAAITCEGVQVLPVNGRYVSVPHCLRCAGLLALSDVFI